MNGNEQTQRLYRRHLSVIYNWAIKKGLLDSNPYNDSPKQTIPKISYYTQKEVEKILDGLGNRKIDKMIKVLFYTGLRRGEAGHLKEEDVLDDLIIVYGKTGRRTIPIPKEIKPIFDDLGIYTFNPESLGLALQKRGLSATKIRHTFATRLVRNGMDLYRIAKLMGHASVKTTEKFYAHLKPIDIKNHSDFLKL